MATRVLKIELRNMHRKVMESVTLPSDAPFRKAVLTLLNLVVGKPDHEVISSFWTISGGGENESNGMKYLMLSKYGTGLR